MDDPFHMAERGSPRPGGFRSTSHHTHTASDQQLKVQSKAPAGLWDDNDGESPYPLFTEANRLIQFEPGQQDAPSPTPGLTSELGRMNISGTGITAADTQIPAEDPYHWYWQDAPPSPDPNKTLLEILDEVEEAIYQISPEIVSHWEFATLERDVPGASAELWAQIVLGSDSYVTPNMMKEYQKSTGLDHGVELKMVRGLDEADRSSDAELEAGKALFWRIREDQLDKGLEKMALD